MADSRSARRWRWLKGARKPSKLAKAMGETIDKLKTLRGRFEARDIVDAAKPKESPIHSMFEWNDRRAGQKYREEQARGYIRALVIVEGREGSEVSMPVAVSMRPSGGYRKIDSVMSSTQLRNQLIEQALREAESWRARYQHLVELASIFEQIDRALAQKARPKK